jgi:hypothetical protein
MIWFSGVLPAPSMEEDLPARLAYINLIKVCYQH